MEKRNRNRNRCGWCGEETKEQLEEAGGCDIIPKGVMCCDKCINIPKKYGEVEDFMCGCRVAFTKDRSEGFAVKLCAKDKEE